MKSLMLKKRDLVDLPHRVSMMGFVRTKLLGHGFDLNREVLVEQDDIRAVVVFTQREKP